MERAASSKECAVVTRDGKEVAAVFPLEDLELLDEIESRRRDSREWLSVLVGRMRVGAVARGVDELTDEEVNVEIRALREERLRRAAQDVERRR